MDPRDEVRRFVVDLLARKGDRGAVSDGESLLEGGRIDSADVLELVTFAEERFGIDFAARGFDAGQFNSIDEIVTLVSS